uniref:Uncharacterized protein n=1 Tax=Pithovirus LCPAC406 TaxID=2506599 RepID=A0A481ZDN4_9VIRU|nr:MAG: uncharacterized protein LCPAC406_00800 [Pithovirus LCPAC406]
MLIEERRDKSLKRLPKSNMKWGRKLIYSGPSVKPVERAVRIRKAFDLVLEEMLSGDVKQMKHVNDEERSIGHIIKQMGEAGIKLTQAKIAVIKRVKQEITKYSPEQVEDSNDIKQVVRRSRIIRRKNRLKVISEF